MLSLLYKKVYEDIYYGRDVIQNFFMYVMGQIYAEPIDCRHTYYDSNVFEIINKTIQEDSYYDVLTLIEAIIEYWDSYLRDTEGCDYYDEYNRRYQGESIYEVVNSIFQREFIGYRFVDGKLTPISDEFELKEVEQALDSPYSSVYDHLSKANKLIADRNKPDYENSIKECISAVEAICEVLTGITGREATLGKMLKKLEENGVVIHSGLKAAFNSLYGYTSDANGIRHAGNIGGPASTFEEAKFMLVSCSAFVNYLIAVNAN